MNKRRFLIISVFFCAATVTFLLLPYVTVYRFQSAIVEKDADEINSHIDHPALRQSFKDQFNAMIMKEMMKEADNPFAALGMGMASMFAERMVDSMITPASISMMIGNRTAPPVKPVENSETEAKKDEDRGREFLTKASFDYKSLSRFAVRIKSEKNEKDELKLIFARDGFSWKLSAIELPMN
jgi:hypothetical protein